MPLHLYNTTPSLSGGNYKEVTDALKKQFHSDSDRWLLRQKLSERKQLPTETVTEYAADVRSAHVSRVDVPTTESISFFIQGLNPETKRYVILQRLETLEEAEDHAKLKESVAEPKPVDRTDEILRAVAELQIAQAPNVAACEFDSAAPNVRENTRDNRTLDRSEITQIIRQELRRANGNQQNWGNQNRNRRTFDGRPICNFCNAKRHKEIPEFHHVTSHPDKSFTTDDPNNKQDLLQIL